MGNQMFAVWKGKGPDQRLFWAKSSPDGKWTQQQVIAGVGTAAGVSAIVSRGSAVVTAMWRGADADNRIWTSTWDDRWAAQELLPGVPRTEDRPALAMLKGELFVAWRGAGKDETIWFMRRRANGVWTSQAPIPGANSANGPALAAFKNELVAAYRGPTGDEGLRWSTFDGTAWSAPVAFRGASSHGPALAATDKAVHMAWKGAGTDTLLWRSQYESSWSAQQTAVGRSSHGPALGTIGAATGSATAPLLLWKGADADPVLWLSRLWAPQSAVANGSFGTSDTPAIVSVSIFTL